MAIVVVLTIQYFLFNINPIIGALVAIGILVILAIVSFGESSSERHHEVELIIIIIIKAILLIIYGGIIFTISESVGLSLIVMGGFFIGILITIIVFLVILDF